MRKSAKRQAALRLCDEEDKEILNNPHHYKPLSNDLKGFYRVHIEKSFVLIFMIEENNSVVEFIDLEHHDEIYRRK